MKRLAFFSVLALAAFSCFAQEALESKSGIALVAIHAAGDSFTMGDGTWGPGTTESISSDYSMSRFLITNSQFGQFVSDGGYNEQSYWTKTGWEWKGRIDRPAFWTNGKFNHPDQPVVGVSWYEAVAFCNWLSIKEGLAPAYDNSGRADLAASGYRLPTEVEWEYAAAKGAPGESRRDYPWGDTWDSALAVCQVRPADARTTADVGSRSPGGDTPRDLPIWLAMSGNGAATTKRETRASHIRLHWIATISRVTPHGSASFFGEGHGLSTFLRACERLSAASPALPACGTMFTASASYAGDSPVKLTVASGLHEDLTPLSLA